MNSILTMPFTQNGTLVATWLDKLNDLPVHTAVLKLYELLSELSNNSEENWQHFDLLVALSPKVFLLSNNLAEENFNETEPAKNLRSLKNAKLGLKLLKLLTNLFSQAAESRELELSKTQLACYYALQLIGYNLRNYALLYQIPTGSLWKQTANLYKTITEINGLDEIQTTNIQIFLAQPTFLNALKRNLLFSLFHAHRYSKLEIEEFFNLSNDYYDLLKINPDYISNSQFYWDQELPPHPVNASKHSFAKDIIKIDCSDFVQLLEEGAITTYLCQETQKKLIQQLSGYRQLLEELDKGIHSISQTLNGFETICQYLMELDKLTKINSLGKILNPVNFSWDQLTLLPMEHESPFYKPIFLSGKTSISGNSVNIIETGNHLVVFTEKNQINTEIGDLSLFFNADEHISLAITLQKIRTKTLDYEIVLFEQIPGDFAIYNFTCNTDTMLPILIINETTANPEAILPSGKYNTNNSIRLNNGKSLYLIACVEYNAYICRFVISFK